MVDPELVAIGAEAPARLTDLGVMPEPGGEGEEPQPGAGAEARECAGAVALEAELSLAGQKDRFDPHVVRLFGPNFSLTLEDYFTQLEFLAEAIKIGPTSAGDISAPDLRQARNRLMHALSAVLRTKELIGRPFDYPR